MSCGFDVLAQQTELPEVEVNDVIAFLDTGAYQDACASNFNALPRPGTVLVRGDRGRVDQAARDGGRGVRPRHRARAPAMSVTITSGELEATFVPKLAMVGASLTHRREELLGMGHGVEGYRDRASTFGIPLLHPWANRLDIPLSSPLLHPDPNGIPIHGVNPSALPFDLLEQSPDRVVAEYTTERSPQALEVFPHPHRLEVAAEVDRLGADHPTPRCTPSATRCPSHSATTPTCARPGADRSTWEITVPDMPQLELDDRMLPTGASHPPTSTAGRWATAASTTPSARLTTGSRSASPAAGARSPSPSWRATATPRSTRRRRTADLLRADDRPHQRPQDRRRAPDAGAGRITHRRIPDRCR